MNISMFLFELQFLGYLFFMVFLIHLCLLGTTRFRKAHGWPNVHRGQASIFDDYTNVQSINILALMFPKYCIPCSTTGPERER